MIDPASSKTKGFHLFFEPKGETREILKAHIALLAKESGGPVFDPHVTLLARIPGQSEEEVLKVSKRLAESLSPIDLTLGTLGAEQKYFRALYARIEDAETIAQYHREAAEAFSLAPDPEYLPHLSLLYGNYSPEEVSRLMGRIPPLHISFSADVLHVYKTEGEVHEWERIGAFPLLT